LTRLIDSERNVNQPPDQGEPAWPSVAPTNTKGETETNKNMFSSPFKYISTTVGRLFSPSPAGKAGKKGRGRPKGKAGGVTKTRKKKQNPHGLKKPKRAMSAYLFFATDVRPSIVSAKPGLKTTDVTKVVAEKWKAMSDADKVPYQKKADKDKKRYEKEMKDFKDKLAKMPALPKDAAEIQKDVEKKLKTILAKSFKPEAFAKVKKGFEEGKSLQINTAISTYNMQGGRGKKPDAMGFMTQLFGVTDAKKLKK